MKIVDEATLAINRKLRTATAAETLLTSGLTVNITLGNTAATSRDLPLGVQEGTILMLKGGQVFASRLNG